MDFPEIISTKKIQSEREGRKAELTVLATGCVQ